MSKALRIKKIKYGKDKERSNISEKHTYVDPATVNSAAFRIFKLTSCRRKRRDFRLMESAIF